MAVIPENSVAQLFAYYEKNRNYASSEWYAGYRNTVKAVMADKDKLEDKTLEKLWYSRNNMVASLRAACPSRVEYEAALPELRKITAEIIKAPTVATYKKVQNTVEQYLAKHNNHNYLNLRPDLLITTKPNNSAFMVMDAKWKLIKGKAVSGKRSGYGLTGSDFHQMFAYGHKYLPNGGNLCLIYPSHDDFDQPIEDCFDFGYSEFQLKLWVIPFCLDVKTLSHQRLKLPKELLNTFY